MLVEQKTKPTSPYLNALYTEFQPHVLLMAEAGYLH
uniref:Uncharacterized protein n=1 Tax=Anguilla anguilla TaxID=7936 RepID=A0A0E9U2L0_ANGAN